jgi:hypothetical protein
MILGSRTNAFEILSVLEVDHQNKIGELEPINIAGKTTTVSRFQRY